MTDGGVGSGLFVAFEGGEGTGKSTQTRLLADRLVSAGHDVVLTHEPGGTPVGQRLREVLLSHETTHLSERAEALLYAADRAHHVHAVIRPALARGAVVITDRYVDSSLAYQGAGRALPMSEVAKLSRWATEGLVPDVTVLLDLPAEVGLRRTTTADRLEAEPLAFHERVRQMFLDLAGKEPDRYLVLDAAGEVAGIERAIWTHLAGRLPARARDAGAPDAAAGARTATTGSGPH